MQYVYIFYMYSVIIPYSALVSSDDSILSLQVGCSQQYD